MAPPARRIPVVYLALRLPVEALARIDAACTVRTWDGAGQPSKQALVAKLGDVEGLLGSAMLPIDADVLEAAPRLRVISNVGVGFDNVDLQAATGRGVLVCNTPDVLTDAV
ncbi:MAG: hypothetical protein U1B78_06575, partial [Dehalococcoidia bacterium]|nr:hypothetical protein [Dehalococcoidia bacterium]